MRWRRVRRGRSRECRVFERQTFTYNSPMRSLEEIESEVSALSLEDKQHLLLFIAAQLRTEPTQMPPVRRFSDEQIRAWIAADEAEMRELLDESEE